MADAGGVARSAVDTTVSMMPLTWITDEIKALNRALDGGDYAALGIHLFLSATYAGLDTATIAGTIFTEGAGAAVLLPADAAAKTAVREGVELFARLITGTVKEKYGAHAAKQMEKILSGTAEKAAVREGIWASLREARELVPFKDNTEMWRALQGEVGKGTELFASLGKYSKTMLADAKATGAEITFMVMDKSKTWQLNALGREFGDMGLNMYFRAAAKAAEKFKKEGVRIVRTTKEGDELVMIYKGADKELERKVLDFMKKEAMAAAESLGLANPKLKEAFAGFSSHSITATAKIGEDGAAQLLRDGKRIGVETLMNKAEVEPLVSSLGKRSQEIIGRFVTLVHGALPPAIEGAKFDKVLTVRVGLGEPAGKAFLELTESAQKGVAHVQMSHCGPSVFNLAGHGVTDFMTAKYFEKLGEAFERYGVKAEIFLAGPMSYGMIYKSPVSEAAMSAAVKEADAMMVKELKDLGVRKVGSAVGATKDIAERELTSRVLGTRLGEASISNIRQNIVILQNDRKMFVNMLDGAKMAIGEKENAIRVLSNLPGWVRTEIDLYQHLANNGLGPSAQRIMQAMGERSITLYDWMARGTQKMAPKEPMKGAMEMAAR